MTTGISHNLYCQLTGLQVGTLALNTTAGHLPYLSHWKEMVVRHPVFSLQEHRLLAFARAEYSRLAKAADDGEATAAEETQLQVCFLAVLHTLGAIKQEIPALPPLHVVQNNMARLFAIAYWHLHLDSQRFRFPSYKINKLNANSDFSSIKDYLDLCFDVKDRYEHEVNEIDEQAKVDEADRALKALRNSWVTPVSNKQLWRWVRANLPGKYEADAQGWMSTLFLGTERAILGFDKEDIALLVEIITNECPRGTGVMHAVTERLDAITKVYTDNKEAFDVDFEEYEESEPLAALRAASLAPASAPAAQPRKQDFAKMSDYLKANALWYLQQRAQEKKAERNATQVGSL